MDEDEDYQALFFAECVELLSELQEQLDRLADGEDDPEIVNAAFRAVHSVKGGAAAFGFDDLIAFAHVFETVMDKVRNDVLQATPEVTSLLVRSGDVLMVLVEHARDGGEPDRGTVDRVAGELHSLAGSEPPEAKEEAEPEAAPDAPAEPAAVDAPASAEPREVNVLFQPHEGFLRAGHEPLKLIRAARELGLVSVETSGEVPGLDEIDLANSPISWKMRFDSSAPVSEFEMFFQIYEAFADVSIEAEALVEPETQEASPEVEAPAEASAETAKPQPKQEPERPQAKPAASGGGGDAAQAKPKLAKTLRVELPRIDRLVNLVGEVVITQAVLAQRLSDVDTGGDLELDHAVESMSRQTRELQESVMAIRAQPVKSVFSRMPRVIRDLADKLGKEARIIVSGEHTEVDTTVIEELAEPLTHMLRNSMDHGLEETPEDRVAVGKERCGTIRLTAEHRGERVLISVEDDGRGINRERVHGKAIERGLVDEEENLSPEDIDNLIFHPGFSTAESVSSVSGRGVGMDVVKKKIQMLGGRCSVQNKPGEGAKFLITLPLTLAVLDGMTVCVGDERFILPLSSVIEAIKIDLDTVAVLPNGSRLLRLRDEYLPLISLRDTLQLGGEERGEEMAIVVDTEARGSVAILVDDLI
ncbi:MAG: chemotaxis protein CheA, partial [Pseudomonadota bacterium]